MSNFVSSIERRTLSNERFCIVSNNCWGSSIYKSLDRAYNTPFVGLFLYPDCYLKLLRNFDRCVSSPIQYKTSSKYFEGRAEYPVGVVLDDIEVHFLHYKSESEAGVKWHRRMERMRQSIKNGERLLFKMCDRDGATLAHITEFHSLLLTSENSCISFSTSDCDYQNHIRVPEFAIQDKMVVDGLLLFEHRYKLFDFCRWVKSGEVSKSIRSQFLRLI